MKYLKTEYKTEIRFHNRLHHYYSVVVYSKKPFHGVLFGRGGITQAAQ